MVGNSSGCAQPGSKLAASLLPAGTFTSLNLCVLKHGANTPFPGLLFGRVGGLGQDCFEDSNYLGI